MTGCPQGSNVSQFSATFIKSAMSALGNVISSIKTSASGSFQSSLTQLASGNVEGAVSTLLQGPGDALDAIGATGSAGLGDALGGINARSDALQTWNWYCVPPPITNSSAISLGSIGGTNLTSSAMLPWYYVQTANLPFRTFQPDTIQRNGHAVIYPESYSVENLTLGLFMDSSSKSMSYISAWQGLVMANQNPKNPTNQGLWGRPSQYKKDIQVVLLSVARQQILKFRYINCWPLSVGTLSAVPGGSDIFIADVTFAVEDVDITISNDQGLINNLINSAEGYAMGALSGVTSGFLNNLSSGSAFS